MCFCHQGIATHLFRVGVTIRVTIYELKSKSALRYHFCFSLPIVEEVVVDDALTMSKTRSLICFEDAVAAADEQQGQPSTANNSSRPPCCPARPQLSDMHRESLRSFESETSTFSQNIGTSTFCKAFPWHFMVDRNMQLVQLGVGFIRLFGSELKKMGRHLATYFQLKKPTVEPNFDKILKKANSPFVLAVCHVTKDSRKTKLEVSRFRFVKYVPNAARKFPSFHDDGSPIYLHYTCCCYPLLGMHIELLTV